MTSRFFDVVENFREERGIDMWSDGLMFDMLDAFISETEEMLGVLKWQQRHKRKQYGSTMP